MHIVVRADGGPDIGLGHVVRTGALAEELLSRDHEVTYATTTPEYARRVCADGIATLELRSRDDPERFANWLDPAHHDIVVTDAYPIDTEYQQLVRETIPLVVLQDDDRHAVAADAFVNGNLYAADLDYSFVGESPRTFLGTDYVLLRSSIRDRMIEEPPWREYPERAIVTMGGGDAAGLTPPVIRAFGGLDLHVDVIVGPGYSAEYERSIRSVAAEVSADTTVTRDPGDLPERMYQADLAVCTASSTVYELLGLGTPIVSRAVADNQIAISDALRERDLATTVEDDSIEEGFRRAIGEYVENAHLRARRRDRGRSVIDGRGVARLADVTTDIVGIQR